MRSQTATVFLKNRLTNNQNTYMLSKYELVNQLEISKKRLRIDIDIDYKYKNIEDVLLLYWLVYIVFEKVSKVSISKTGRIAVISTYDTNFLYLTKLQYFLYNVSYIKNNKKNIAFYSLKNLYLSLVEKRHNFLNTTPLTCYFKANFKKEPLDHIFSDLGVSSYRLGFTITLIPMSTRDYLMLKRNNSFDQISMENVDNRIKSYF